AHPIPRCGGGGRGDGAVTSRESQRTGRVGRQSKGPARDEVRMTKILVIEDNEGVREEIVEILRFEGYDVRDAENGRLGLQLVKQWPPDLVICDLMMPELDGYATLEAMRADPASAATPFLCLTARCERRDMRRAMELGAD